MSLTRVDTNNHTRLAELRRRVLEGGKIDRDEGQWLFELESTTDIFDLLAWANRIREHFNGVIRFLRRRHFNEGEAAGLAGELVEHDVD